MTEVVSTQATTPEVLAVATQHNMLGSFRSTQRFSLGSLLASRRLLRTRVAKPNLPTPKFEKRLDVVIMGAPNAGKSVLINALIKTKLSATSRKRHTTRAEILGVFNHRNTQLAFYDTPGYVRKAEAVKSDAQVLSQRAAESTKKADVVLLVVDSATCTSTRYHEAFCEMVKVALENAKKEIILVLNKVDLIKPKSDLLEFTHTLVSFINGIKHGPGGENKAKLDTTTFMISALEDDGLIDIKNYLLGIADIKPWVVGVSKGVTSVSMERRVEEMVYEKLLDVAHDEIPYISEIQCTGIKEMGARRVGLEVDIWVDTPGQQRILVGQQGRTLVKIRQAAVEELEKIMGVQVILKIYIRKRSEKVEMFQEKGSG
jgi:GTP-binding protein Era